MDKPKLSKDQLLQLVNFIKRRGFRQPLLIAEILDHFACKVEEKMFSFPGISLEKAMTDAHADFGFSGFAPIVNAYQGGIKKKYSTVYKAELRKTLLMPIPVLLSVVAFFAFYISFIWAGKNNYNHLSGINDACLGLYLAYILCSVYFAIKYFSGFETDYIKSTILGQDVFFVFPILVLLPLQHINYCTLPFGIMSFVGSLGAAYLVIRHYTLYKVLAIGIDENTIVENYLKGIGA